ncbi:HlyD family secretion protein [compost metagenome]
MLYLPVSAVYEENGVSVVYVEDGDGFKSVKEIKTGFTAERKIEILSGLEEGDSVILE